MTKKILGEHNFVDEILKLFRTPMKQAILRLWSLKTTTARKKLWR